LRNSLLALAVCAVLALSGTPRAASADDTLTVIGASTTAGFFEVLDHVAELAGFFKAEHLIVDKQYITAASQVAQLVASGKADVASMSVEPVLQGYDRGLRLQYFFGTDPQYVYALGVLADSPIRTLADFKGTEIGELTPGSPAEIVVQSMLAGAGLKKSDYSFVPIGTGAQALTAVVAKKVVGEAFPAGALVMQGVEGHQTFRFYRHPILKDIGTYGFAALPATIANKSDQLKRYCRALVEAAILIRENPRLAARDFLVGAGLAATPAAIDDEAQVLRLAQGDLPAAGSATAGIGYMPPRGMAIYAQFLVDNGMATGVAPAAAVVTDRFIAYANDFDEKAFAARVKTLR
jgi:NitT/TauT family transport system substrate-binding protein